MLAEQKKLEDQYVALVAEQPQLRNLPNKNKLYENQKAVHTVAEQLRLGTQALVRNLKVGLRLSCPQAKKAMQPVQHRALIPHQSASLSAVTKAWSQHLTAAHGVITSPLTLHSALFQP